MSKHDLIAGIKILAGTKGDKRRLPDSGMSDSGGPPHSCRIKGAKFDLRSRTLTASIVSDIMGDRSIDIVGESLHEYRPSADGG
ncbi:hypothetical protein EVAR_95925_1 [Eumeta japonica]|uniref:Uncharacterized protein n=1 Tax=Eumeta variegata TaxID=151549 RepID=A0A4C1SZL9_EUMVA|nr:hypothetical protein EVAR_95925_1 [Eumeta japonica]